MPSPDVAFLAPSASTEDTGHEATTGTRVDVLILTALQDELGAVLALAEGWDEQKDLGGFRYHRRTFTRSGKRPLMIAAAWLGDMGEVAVAMRGVPLVQELRPACVAMCGICAGLRGEVALGDVIVADRVYSYDHGKLIAAPEKDEEFQHDIVTHNLPPLLKMEAASLGRVVDLTALSEGRPPSKDAQRRWLLHAQYAHEAEGAAMPIALAERKKKCPGWSARVQEAIDGGLATLDDGVLALTGEKMRLILC